MILMHAMILTIFALKNYNSSLKNEEETYKKD